jgi:hypothetical protein
VVVGIMMIMLMKLEVRVGIDDINDDDFNSGDHDDDDCFSSFDTLIYN